MIIYAYLSNEKTILINYKCKYAILLILFCAQIAHILYFSYDGWVISNYKHMSACVYLTK